MYCDPLSQIHTFTTSPHPIHFEFEQLSTSRFPTSSVRPHLQPPCSATLPLPPPPPIAPRYDPLGVFVQAEADARRATALSTAITVPRSLMIPPTTHEIAPGVLQDGTLTTHYPVLRDYLRQVSAHPENRPPPPTSAPLFALGALATFYRPTHPAHWVFWNRDEKQKTAEIVQRILSTTPAPIASPIGWIGIPENLWILSSVQHAHRPLLVDVPWHAALNPSPLASPSGGKRMNLRKRKVPAGALRDETPSEIAEDRSSPASSPRKKPRTKRITRSGPRMALLGDANSEAEPNLAIGILEEPIAEDAPLAPLTKEAKMEHVNSSIPEVSPHSVVTELDNTDLAFVDPLLPQAPVRTSMRQKARKEHAMSSHSNTPAPSGLLLMQPPFTRTDSGSSSGESTVVSRSRSTSSDLDSNLSASTVVDLSAEAESLRGQKGAKPVDVDVDVDAECEKVEVPVNLELPAKKTRARTRTTRTSARTANPKPYPQDKEAQVATGRGKSASKRKPKVTKARS